MKIVIILLMMTTMTHPIFSKKQSDFYYRNLKRFNILSGVTGSGKSFASNLKVYEYLVTKKNKLFLFSGNTGTSLYDNVIKPLVYDIDSGLNWLEYKTVASTKRIYCKYTGSEAVCIGANDETAQNRIQGKNVELWYADEVTKQPKSFIDMAISRGRSTETGEMVTTPIIWTCNPDAPTHYIKTDYIDRIEKGEIDGINYFYGFKDNPMITPQFVKELEATFSGVFLERMIHGKWVLAEGMVFDKFSRSTHVVSDYPIEQVKGYELGIDWGYAQDHALAILLIAITDDADYVIDEIYLEKQLIDGTLLSLIKSKGWLDLPCRQFGTMKKIKPSLAIADSARPDHIDAFYNYTGINCVPAMKDVDEGIQSVNRAFSDNVEKNLYVLKKCVNCIRELETYCWDKSISSDMGKNVPLKKNDHCPDALRYWHFTTYRGSVRRVADPRSIKI